MYFARSVLFTLAAIFIISAADDPFIGTWKLNTEKSRTNAGATPAAGGIIISATQDGYQIDLASGRTIVTLLLDEKNHPRKGGVADRFGADTAAGRRVGVHRIETSFKRGGKIVATVNRELDANGLVLTATTEGTTVSGEKYRDVSVFDKH